LGFGDWRSDDWAFAIGRLMIDDSRLAIRGLAIGCLMIGDSGIADS
jgi:hypothetical protein